MDRDINHRSRVNYERMRESSLSGKQVERIRERREREEKEQYRRRIRTIIGATAVAVGICFSLGNVAISELQDRMTIDDLAHEYQVEVVGPETHRTNDNTGYFYDYNDIAKKVESGGNVDEAIYLLDHSIGEYQTNLILEHTSYGSFDDYLEQKGYASHEDFQSDMRSKVLLSSEISNKQRELQQMSDEHHESEIVSNDYKGEVR